MSLDGPVEDAKEAPGRRFSRRKLLIAGGASALVPVAAGGLDYDAGLVSVERHRVVVPGLARAVTAVQLSDLHADRAGSCSPWLRDRVEEQIRTLEPDLIFATGDFITRPCDSIEEAARWLAGLWSREGTYAVMGNH